MTQESYCERCGAKFHYDYRNNPYCPNYINCSAIANKRLKALDKGSRLEVKGTSKRGVGGFFLDRR